MTHGKSAEEATSNGLAVSVARKKSVHAVDQKRLMSAARRVLVEWKFKSATIRMAVVDEPTIQGLNRQFLNHDWPTDVLSFVLEASATNLKGEVVLSADTAATVAAAGGWKAADEQLLYVIHGVLHLVGLDDQDDETSRRMRAAERYYLHEFGVELPEGPVSEDGPANDIEPLATTEDTPGGGGLNAW